MIKALKHSFHLFRVVVILGRHGALFSDEISENHPFVGFMLSLFNRKRLKGRIGERLADALYRLGPTYIKLGQVLATRSDFIGEEIAADLSKLQDDLPSFDGDEALKIVEKELGANWQSLFKSFDKKAIAAASIAQVHKAETIDGRRVAVKILRPNIEQKFKRDIDTFYWVSGVINRYFPSLERLKAGKVVETFEKVSAVEMDLRMEASAASEFQENFKGDQRFLIPNIQWDLTAERVLTLDYVEGVRLDDVKQIEKMGLNPDEILKSAAEGFFRQVFEFGFFHADLHPGNFLVGKDGRIRVIDFGIMGRLDHRSRYFLADLLSGFLERDYDKVSRVHFEYGAVPKGQSHDLFMQACRSIGEPILNKPINQISVGRLLGQLFAITEQFQMEVQPQLLLLQKSMLTAEGIGRILNPRLNMWELARPLIERWVRQNRGPVGLIKEDLRKVKSFAMRLPEIVDQFSEALSIFHTASQKSKKRNARFRRLKYIAMGALLVSLGYGAAIYTI